MFFLEESLKEAYIIPIIINITFPITYTRIELEPSLNSKNSPNNPIVKIVLNKIESIKKQPHPAGGLDPLALLRLPCEVLEKSLEEDNGEEIFLLLYKPVPGILVFKYVPLGPIVRLAPLGPILVLIPFLLRLICTPGAIFILLLKFQDIINKIVV